MNKTQAAEAFLKSLENQQITMDIMLDRIDVQTLAVINNYASLIAKVKERGRLDGTISQQDIVVCSMIIGYLLKSQMDRFDMEESLKKLNTEE